MVFEERLILSKEDSGDIVRNEHLARYRFAAQFVRGKKVLDIACGSGYGSKLLAESGASEVVGFDCDAEMAAENQKNNSLKNLIYKEGNAVDIPAREREFDIAVSFETIEHLKDEDQEKFVLELKRTVSDEGLVLISTPNLVISNNKNPYHIKELNREDFENILKKYFPAVVVFEQGNGIASFIRNPNSNIIKESEIVSFSEPLYFLAVCSKREIPEIILKGEGMGSVSVAAYNRLKNNPVLKISNKIYPIIKKLFRK